MYKVFRVPDIAKENQSYKRLAISILNAVAVCAAITICIFKGIPTLDIYVGSILNFNLFLLIVLIPIIAGAIIIRKINKMIRNPDTSEETKKKNKKNLIVYTLTAFITWVAMLIVKIIFYADFAPPSGS